MYMQMGHAYQSAHVEIKGEILEVYALPHVGFKDLIRVVKLVSKCLYVLSYFTSQEFTILNKVVKWYLNNECERKGT